MASAAERTSYSSYWKKRKNAEATVSFLLISAAVGSCCCGAPWTLLSSRGFVWSGRCDCAGKGVCCEAWASADGPAKEQTKSTTTAKARSAKYPASKHLGRIGSLLCAESTTGGSANTLETQISYALSADSLTDWGIPRLGFGLLARGYDPGRAAAAP